MITKLKTTILFVATLLFAISCNDALNDFSSRDVDSELSKGPKGGGGGGGEVDDDSDRPDWAGSGKNKPGSGTTGGSKDYGDMIVILRDVDGVPIMKPFLEIDENGEEIPGTTFYVYQPLDINDNELQLDQYGEVMNPLAVVEVDFGRLNIIRSPESVITQALNEVLTAMKDAEKFTQDFCGRLSIWKYVDVTDEDGNVESVLQITKTIDSPRESMAIYREIMRAKGGWGQLSAIEEKSTIVPLDLAAASFAAGSDKTGNVDVDEVEYVNGMMKIPGTLPCLDEKLYFNFQDYDYDRDLTFSNRWLIFYDFIDGKYIENHRESVLEAMEGRGLFSEREIPGKSNVDGFAWAIDDAVQVLEFVHGNSNIEFVPN